MGIKQELFYLRQSIFEQRQGFKYLINRYFIAPKLLRLNQNLEKPINENNFSIHILSCHRDMIMLVWALASFYQYSSVIGQVYIHNDGSLTDRDKAKLKKLFPSIEIVNTQSFVKEFDEALNAYPLLKKLRTEQGQFSFKKLIDPYFVSSKDIQLIIDSDILWFTNPEEISSVVKDQINKSLIQKNNTNIQITFSDGLSLKQEFTGCNSGIVLFRKKNINLEALEQLFEKIDLSNKKNLHFADQYGYPYCLASLELLPDTYHIKGLVSEKTVARHYTGPRRHMFYIEGIEKLKDEILS